MLGRARWHPKVLAGILCRAKPSPRTGITLITLFDLAVLLTAFIFIARAFRGQWEQQVYAVGLIAAILRGPLCATITIGNYGVLLLFLLPVI